MKVVTGCLHSHLDGARNAYRLYNERDHEQGRVSMKKGSLSDCANCRLTPDEKVCMNPKGKGRRDAPR